MGKLHIMGEPLDIQEVLRAARAAEVMRAELQDFATENEGSLRNTSPHDTPMNDGETVTCVQPVKWTPNKVTYMPACCE